MAGWALFVQALPPEVVFGQLYFSDGWQQVFAVDNSIPLWSLVLVAGLWLRRDWLVVFAATGVLHLGCDFFLHHDDARRHFWPLSDYVFRSPFSYWDPAYHGAVLGPTEGVMSVLLCYVLWKRFRGGWARAFIALAGALEFFPMVMFRLLG